MDLQDKVALVTGASRGIGKAIAAELAARGACVIGTATSEAGAQGITEALAGQNGSRGVVLEVNDAAAVDALIDALVKESGGPHILVNNAGITRDTLAMRMKDDDWTAVIDTNLSAVFRLSRAVMRGMMKAKWGRIVNVTSVVGASGNAGQANYGGGQGRCGRTDTRTRPRTRQPEHYRKLRGAWLHRYRHDQVAGRYPDQRVAGPDSAGPPWPPGRYRPRRGLSGVPGRRVCDRYRAACERRHVHELSYRILHPRYVFVPAGPLDPKRAWL